LGAKLIDLTSPIVGESMDFLQLLGQLLNCLSGSHKISGIPRSLFDQRGNLALELESAAAQFFAFRTAFVPLLQRGIAIGGGDFVFVNEFGDSVVGPGEFRDDLVVSGEKKITRLADGLQHSLHVRHSLGGVGAGRSGELAGHLIAFLHHLQLLAHKSIIARLQLSQWVCVTLLRRRRHGMRRT